MRPKNINFRSSILALLFVTLTACTGLQRSGPGQQGSQPFEESKGETSYPEQTESTVEPVQKNKKRVAVVLGPGAFKTFAYPSFIKSLAQSGVKPDEIIGVEWGALTGAFYANFAKPHEAEWKVYKLKSEEVEKSSLFSSGKGVPTDSLRKYLKENLGERKISETAIAFQCPRLNYNRGTVVWKSRGKLWKNVEDCLASAPRFQPSSGLVPSLLTLDQIANSLRRRGVEVIILVNVMGQQGRLKVSKDWLAQTYWAEVRRHIWQSRNLYTDVIDIDTDQFGPFDFRAKTGLKSAGEKAGKAAARRLIEKYNL